MKVKFLCGFILFASILSLPVFGHELSSGYLSLQTKDSRTYTGDLWLKPADIGQAAGLDSNNDGQLSWREVNERQTAAAQYIAKTLTLVQQQRACSLSVAPPAVTEISSQTQLRYPLSVECPSSGELMIAYDGIFPLSAGHKMLVTVNIAGQQYSQVLTRDAKRMQLSAKTTSALTQFINFVYEGIWHIWIGLDHILFLIATLLTVNLTREHKAWRGVTRRRAVIKNTLYLVTAFTLAHSITLTMTALGFVTPDSRWVEIGIAITVLFTAMNNIYPVIVRLGIVTFLFGLLHGMGFASVFAQLNAQSDSLIMNVAAFNIGVELGQLAIVLTILPLLLLVRKWPLYWRTLMPVSSSLIAMVALNWAIQRW